MQELFVHNERLTNNSFSPNSRRMRNRIKELRTERGWSLEKLASRANASFSQIQKLEKGDRRMTTEWMERLAKAFDISPMEIVSDTKGGQTVPIVGFVGAGDVVNEFDNGDVLEEVPCPHGIEEGGRGYCIRGDSNKPYLFNGWYVFTNRCFAGMVAEYIGELCIVKTTDGSVYLKVVTKGSKAGHFNLVSQNPEYETIRDVVIVESCIIDAMIPRRQFNKL